MGKKSATKSTANRSNRTGKNNNVVRLAADVAQRSADSLKSQCLKALSKRKNLVVDARDVERISTACVQVLLSAAKGHAGAGRFAIRGPSEAFIKAFSELGLFATLTRWKIVK